jgi:uncharacterized membrane protein YtjA (UPF0391 family)
MLDGWLGSVFRLSISLSAAEPLLMLQTQDPVSGAFEMGGLPGGKTPKGSTMLYWALMFFIIAIVAAVFGFGGIAAGAATIAKFLFFLFVLLFVIALISGLLRGRTPRL